MWPKLVVILNTKGLKRVGFNSLVNFLFSLKGKSWFNNNKNNNNLFILKMVFKKDLMKLKNIQNTHNT